MLETHQQIDMDQRPEAPGKPAFEPPPAEIEHGRMPADDRGVAAIVEMEWFVPALPREKIAQIDTLLLGDLRETWKRLAGLVRAQRDVAQRIDAIKPRHRQIGRDRHATRAVER